MTTAERFRVLLFRPWWRAAWFIGAVAWAVAFNLAWIGDAEVMNTWGFVSVIPIFAFTADVLVRERRLAAAAKTARARP